MKNLKKNVKTITEAWAPMITKVTGIKESAKLEWMSQLANNQAKHLNEADGYAAPFGLGGALQSAPGAMGGAYMPYNTLYNTVGVGNAVPGQIAAMSGAAQANPAAIGSGDKWPALLPLAMKVAAKTIGFELVNTTTLQGPTGVLPYMDYVYSGSKAPYGATPAYNGETANPHSFQAAAYDASKGGAFSLYGLPHAFKATLIPNGSTAIVDYKRDSSVALNSGDIFSFSSDATAWTANPGKFNQYDSSNGVTANDDKNLVVEFIGWSRIDGDPMFKVLSGAKSLGDYFLGGQLAATTVKSVNTGIQFSLSSPRLISLLEDHIQGFAGAGPQDKDPWYGTYQDGKHVFEPMSRATGELQYARQLSLQVFTKNIQVGTISVSVAVTQEQVTDLQKQWGIDVVKMVENAGVNELSQTINRHITSRLFALGWKNHCKLYEVEGDFANLNISFAGGTGETAKYAIPQTYTDTTTGAVSYTETLVEMPVRQAQVMTNAHFENRDTMIKRIMTNMMTASNWILQRGRFGAATFAVTNLTVASLLQTDAQYSFSPIPNNISQNGNSLYPIGTMFGMTIYVDPLMSASDTRVLVGRKGGKDEPGVHFCPYLLAESVKIIAEGTMAPKVQIKSRYALVDAGFFPETAYLTFYANVNGLV